jgi:hypothetical protein
MKKLLIISSVFLSSSLFCNELAWVDEQVEAIKPARTGMSSKALAGTYNPFIFLKKKAEANKTTISKKITSSTTTKSVKTRKQVLTLSLIMNNSAKINDGWYKTGDKINGYKVKRIDSKSVLLTKKKKQLLLSTRSSSKNLKFNNK